MSEKRKIVTVAFDNAIKVGKTEYTFLSANDHKMDITLEDGYLYFKSLFDGSHSGCPVQRVKWFILENETKVTVGKPAKINTPTE